MLACPFGVPRYVSKIDQMMKCDMCYDRTSVGKRPMCVTVCPSGALFFGTREAVEQVRRERPMSAFRFGQELVTTKVRMMMPGSVTELEVDVAELVEGDLDGGKAGLEGRLPDFVGR